ncbi:MAG: hypothetical protein QOK41_1568 [Sphingomonadales bacterium]|jgi:hypothetical protein|nr:hypothetical protein [Sphingomonadales bacterium]
MGGRKSLALMLAGIVAAAATSSPAGAQCRLCDDPTTARPADGPNGDVQLQIETGLNFDRLILSGSGAGAATIRPDGSSSAAGAVADVGPRAMVGTVLVHGDAGRAVRVELPRRIELYSLSGGRITLDEVTSDLPPAPRLDAAGNLSFRFGGRLTLTGDADGQYRGDLPVTVEYL